MKSKNQIQKIREAVCKNRGGLDGASDDQIMIIWRHPPEETQKQYLESIKERKDDAVSHTTKRDV